MKEYQIENPNTGTTLWVEYNGKSYVCRERDTQTGNFRCYLQLTSKYVRYSDQWEDHEWKTINPWKSLKSLIFSIESWFKCQELCSPAGTGTFYRVFVDEELVCNPIFFEPRGDM